MEFACVHSVYLSGRRETYQNLVWVAGACYVGKGLRAR